MDVLLAAIAIDDNNTRYINKLKQEIILNKSAKEELYKQYNVNKEVILGLTIINGMLNDDKTAIVENNYDTYIKYK